MNSPMSPYIIDNLHFLSICPPVSNKKGESDFPASVQDKRLIFLRRFPVPMGSNDGCRIRGYCVRGIFVVNLDC